MQSGGGNTKVWTFRRGFEGSGVQRRPISRGDGGILKQAFGVRVCFGWRCLGVLLRAMGI